MTSNHESDTASVYVYDIDEMAFGEKLFGHSKYDVVGADVQLDAKRNFQLVGFVYDGKYKQTHYFNAAAKAEHETFQRLFPNAKVNVTSRSIDNKVKTLTVSGPQHPDAYYLFKNEKIQLLGSAWPYLDKESLSNTLWVSYKARDGLKIPSLITIPKGDAPHPVVVMPHGGPVARDVWGFDPWVQMLASHGYLVIQPQYRISNGLGRKHLEAGFGRWGFEMQDDLEDGLKFLIDKKLADPKRTAIFGWSYGGYAAFMGSLRDPNPFQCAIAGAGVADVPFLGLG